VWVPSGDSWVEPNPQPPVDEFGFADGSVCTARGFHDLLYTASRWQVCLDCGQVEPL
jgi:hypothetical protein